MLVHPIAGSWFFLAVILTDLELTPASSLPDRVDGRLDRRRVVGSGPDPHRFGRAHRTDRGARSHELTTLHDHDSLAQPAQTSPSQPE